MDTTMFSKTRDKTSHFTLLDLLFMRQSLLAISSCYLGSPDVLSAFGFRLLFFFQTCEAIKETTRNDWGKGGGGQYNVSFQTHMIF